MISTNTRIVAISGSLLLLALIIELVRRRRMKEEYSVLWVATALVLIMLAAWGGALRALTHAIGAISEASTLYFFGLLFVFFLLLHFSIRVSLLERRLTALVQETALLARNRAPETPADEAEGDEEHAQEAGEVPRVRQDDAMRT
jgi:hypothetical protein